MKFISEGKTVEAGLNSISFTGLHIFNLELNGHSVGKYIELALSKRTDRSILSFLYLILYPKACSETPNVEAGRI